MCFTVWFEPKVSVNRLEEVSMLLHLIFFLVRSVKILAGQVQIWATGYLLSPVWQGNKNTDAGAFLDPLAQHQDIVPQYDQYEAVSGMGGHMVSHSDWALEHASSDFSFAHLFWAVSLLHPHSGNSWHQWCAHTAQVYCHAHWNHCKINGQIF